ncbi:hypothetical protein [Bradyrhizobium barranii]|nr:hypothetical protein [Bradyrhizobium barranii]
MKRSRFSDAVLEFGCLQRLAAAPRGPPPFFHGSKDTPSELLPV